MSAAGLVLAAGEGARLRPLTDLRPKALCPVGGVPLVDHALDRLAAALPTSPDGAARDLFVNAFHHAGQVVDHLTGRPGVQVTVEPPPEALGTAGALGALRDRLDGRDVLVTNADVWMPAGLGAFATGWDGERCRLLCVPVGPQGGRVDFEAAPDGAGAAGSVGLRYVGACLLPWRLVRHLAATPSGLYEVLWRFEDAASRLDLVTPDGVGAPGAVIDCGTPQQYLGANLDAVRRAGRSLVDPDAVVSGRVEESVVGAGACVAGDLVRTVVWDGAHVAAGERLVDAVRASGPGGPVTVPAGPGRLGA